MLAAHSHARELNIPPVREENSFQFRRHNENEQTEHLSYQHGREQNNAHFFFDGAVSF